MSRPPNLCVYCGKPGITKEHIRGAWSRKFEIGRKTNVRHTLHRWENGNLSGTPKILRGALNRPGSPRSQTLKIACKSCNTGWMKDVVDRAIPVVKAMSLGYWGGISHEDVLALAAWITLSTMSYEFADKETVAISQFERDCFRVTAMPSDSWQICIGYGEPTPGIEEITHRGFAIRPTPYSPTAMNTQITAFYFGKLLALSFYTTVDLQMDVGTFAAAHGLARIWPNPRMPVRKPFYIHHDASITDLIESFTSLAQRSAIAQFLPK